MRSEKGFTLIELMIVAAIVAILTALALPAYRVYAVRARISDALVSVAGYKVAVLENVANDAALRPRSCANVGPLAGPIAHVESINCRGDGVLVVKTTELAGNVTLTFTPTMNASSIVEWRCGLEEGDPRYVPADCRG